jgi:NTP pyrophosphatase (non-canonical NTP hydrolase)
MSSSSALSPGISIAHYFSEAAATDRLAPDAEGFDKLRFGFFGEVGGLLSAIKKVYRDQLQESETEVAGEEIGDALWYLVNVAHALKVSPEDLGVACMRALRARFKECDVKSPGAANFRAIDGIVAVHASGLEAKRNELLGELAEASGNLLAAGDQTSGFTEVQASHNRMGSLLALLALVAAAFNVKLDALAVDNLAKIHSRWPGDDRRYEKLYDEVGYEEYEQLPRTMEIEFIERGTGENAHVVQRYNGVFIGDRLTDNSDEADDYRFHDVFHLAYIAHLGWSPVVRGLLKLKRKSRRSVDENQDGARAMIIEEGIATWIFNHAKRRQFYANIETNKLDYSLLKQVRGMVVGYEVESCPPWQWEAAILEGFKAFRELQKYRRGIVKVDMVKHTIEFIKMKEEKAS